MVTKESRNLIVKIIAVYVVLVATLIALRLNVHAASFDGVREKVQESAQDFSNIASNVRQETSTRTITGPSKSFLNEFDCPEVFELRLKNRSILYKVYASAFLDDGSIIYAAEDMTFILVKDGILTVGKWGDGAMVPKRTYKDFEFDSDSDL